MLELTARKKWQEIFYPLNSTYLKPFTSREKIFARRVLRKWHPAKPTLPENLKIKEMIIPEKVETEVLIKQWIDKGLLPSVLSQEDLYIERANRIYLLGYKKENEQPKIIFVFKFVNLERNEAEPKNLENAYLYWQRKKCDKAVVRVGEYQLKMSWHERLFHDSKRKVGYELLHVAKGDSMKDYIEEIFMESKTGYVFDINALQFIEDENLEQDIGNQYAGLREKLQQLTGRYHLEQDLKKIFFYFRGDVGKAFNIEKSIEFAKALDEKFSPIEKEFQTLMEQIVKLRKRYLLSPYWNGLIFTPEGDALVNNTRHTKTYTAYNALGTILAAVFKIYDLPIDNRALDPHSGNIFFDDKTKTVTWIDLDWWGPVVRGSKTDNIMAQMSAFKFALSIEEWRSYFKHNGHFLGSPLFFFSAELFFPENERTPEITAKLVEQRNILFHSIRQVYEHFIKGFLDQYPAEDRERVQQEMPLDKIQFLKPIEEVFDGDELTFKD